MAKDSKRDDGTDPTSDTARRRKVASSLLKAAPPVSTTLDAFIARANEELQDVAAAPFRPEHREGLLVRQIDELKAELATASSRAAAAEARAVAAEVRAAAAEVGAAASEVRAAGRRGSTRWGVALAAFVVGGAAMFALSFVLPGKPAVEPASTPVATPVVTAPSAAPTVTPITPPPPVTAEPIAEPVAPPPPPAPAVVPGAVATPDKVIKKPVGKPRRPAAREDSAATPKPPDDDLYNPF